MNFYDLFTNSIYLYLSDWRAKMEFGFPVITGSYGLMLGFIDISVVTIGLGLCAAIIGVAEKSLRLRREYIALKLDKAKADKIMKNLEDDDPNNDKDILKDNGSNI